MTTRQEQIEQIAAIIAAWPAPEGDDEPIAPTWVNRDGWTFDTSGPLGHTIRHGGVVLSDAELERAVALAQQWIAEPARA